MPGPLARTVADAALLLDAMIGDAPFPFTLRAPRWDGGALLNAAVRGEGRFQLGVTTSSPWDDRVRHRGLARGTRRPRARASSELGRDRARPGGVRARAG